MIDSNWIVAIVVGAVAGWIGSFLYRGKGSGLVWNVILGIGGAIVGTRIFEKLGIDVAGLKGVLLKAAVGAFVLLWFFHLIAGKRR